MAKPQPRRISRGYRSLPPAKFHAFNQRVCKGLSGNPLIPASTWGANPDLISVYLAASEKHDAVYHEASFGSILVIAQRVALEDELISLLDEIAADLEAAAVRNPDILLSSGFDLSKERRTSSRAKPALNVVEVSRVEHTGSNP
jgi:hypothetical protein